MPDESQKDQPVVTSWQEYQERQPNQAQLVENFVSYRDLCNIHRVFYNQEFYQTFQEELGGNWLKHEGVKWYEKHLKEVEPEYRAASDAEIQLKVKARVEKRTKELKEWEKDNPELYQGVEDIIKVLADNQIDKFDEQEMQVKTQASLFHFKALLLAAQIGKDKQNLNSGGA